MAVDCHGVSLTINSSETRSTGARFTTKCACTLTNCAKTGDSGATRCRLFSDGGSLLATGSVSGDNATFNYALSDATTYRLEWDNSGASYQEYRAVASYPYVGTNINFVSGSRDQTNNDSAAIYNLTCITTTTSRDVNVSTLTLSLTSEVPDYFLDITTGALELNLSLKSVEPPAPVEPEDQIGGRGNKWIRTSYPKIKIGEVLSLEPRKSHVMRKNRAGIDR